MIELHCELRSTVVFWHGFVQCTAQWSSPRNLHASMGIAKPTTLFSHYRTWRTIFFCMCIILRPSTPNAQCFDELSRSIVSQKWISAEVQNLHRWNEIADLECFLSYFTSALTFPGCSYVQVLKSSQALTVWYDISTCVTSCIPIEYSFSRWKHSRFTSWPWWFRMLALNASLCCFNSYTLQARTRSRFPWGSGGTIMIQQPFTSTTPSYEFRIFDVEWKKISDSRLLDSYNFCSNVSSFLRFLSSH